MDAPANPETKLLRLLESGDVRQAAHVLVTHHADEVYGLCRAMIRDGTAAEDVSQDVFAKAFKALPKFRGDASVRTWILRITRNACIDHIRKSQREPLHAEAEPDAQPVEEPSIADLLSRRESVTRALDALEEGERALVVLRFGHGLGYPELADAFALKPGTVRMRVSRALTKMRAAADAVPTPQRKLARRRARVEAPSAPPRSRAAPAPAAPSPAAPSPAAPSPAAPSPAAPAPSAAAPRPTAPGAPPPLGALPPEAPPRGAPELPAAASAPQAPPAVPGGAGPRDSKDELEATLDLAVSRGEGTLSEAFADGAEDDSAEDDATRPFETDRDEETTPFSTGAPAAARRGGSSWFGWLGRLFARDRVPAEEAAPMPEAPPAAAFSAAPPPALRARLDRMAASVGKTAAP